LDAASALAEELEAQEPVAVARTARDLLPENQDERLFVARDLAFFAPPSPAEPGDVRTPQRRAQAVATLRERLGQVENQDLQGPAQRLRTLLGELTDMGDRALSVYEADVVDPLVRFVAVTSGATTLGPLSLQDVPETFLRSWLAEDGTARVRATPEGDALQPEVLRRFADAVLSVDPDATGAAVTVVEGGRVVEEAFLTALAISAASVLVILAITLRNVLGVALTLLTPAVAAIWTAAGASLFGVPVNFANVIVLPLLFGLGASASIHMVARFLRYRPDSSGGVQATSTPFAVALSAGTTLASFSSLLASAHLGMRSMGALLTIAIVAILAAALLTLPAVLGLASRAGYRGDAGRKDNTVEPEEA
jgi:predicted exporter